MRKFGTYEILHELRSGGMGSVLLARKKGLGAFERLVAIKTIRSEFAGTPAVRAMFLDEAAILSRLNHPAIASVHDFGEEDGTLYMVMEYVAGIPFRDLLQYKPPPIVIARAVSEACRGLHAAHELHDLAGHPLDLVHRDISPDNLMLGFDGHVKVIDFGIALVKKNRQAPVTELGMVKGKPPYMSPEQIANEPMDRRSDIFSLGAVLWELLTQRPLFEGDSIYSIALAVTNQAIVPPSEVRDEPLPPGLDAAVMHALERDLSRRTSTAAAFAEQLEQVIQDSGGETLEAWAARVLTTKRDEHREWLADVAAGTALPKAVGRATGQMTEVAQLPAVDAVAPLAPNAPADTSIGGEDTGLSIPPRNRLAPIAILLLALLVAGGVAYLALARHTTMTPAPVDAATMADAIAIADAPAVVVDAASVVIDAAPVVIDARTIRDASVHVVTVRPDAAHRVDAAVDAAVAAGSGTITIKYKPGPYANISIDDGPALPGPLFKRKVSAGRHSIKFLDAKTGDVLDEQSVDVHDGDALTIRQHE